MKKIITIFLLAVMATGLFAFMGCQQKYSENAEIRLDYPENNITAEYTKSYNLPDALVYENGKVIKSQITLTCKGPDGSAVAVTSDRKISPSELGEYTVTYNAAAGGQKVKPLILKVNFVHSGPVVVLNETAYAYSVTSNFSNYEIPQFQSIGYVKDEYKNLTANDFTSEVSAVFKENLASEGSPVTNPETPQIYPVGYIVATYHITAINDSSVSADYDFTVSVQDVWLAESKNRGMGDVKLTFKENKGEFNTGNSYYIQKQMFAQWSGHMFSSPSDLIDALNDTEKGFLVIDAYNPSPYYLKCYYTVYDDGEYSDGKTCFLQSYIARPKSYFKLYVTRGLFGQIWKIDFNANCDPLPEGYQLPESGIQEEPYLKMPDGNYIMDDNSNKVPYYPSNEMYILKTSVLNENDIMVHNLYDFSSALPDFDVTPGDANVKYELSAYNENGLSGMRMNKTSSGWLTLHMASVQNELLLSKFMRAENKHNAVLAFDANNIGSTMAHLYIDLYQSSLYTLCIGGWPDLAAGSNKTYYINVGMLHDVWKDVNWRNFDIGAYSNACDIVLSNFRVIEFEDYSSKSETDNVFEIKPYDSNSNMPDIWEFSFYKLPSIEDLAEIKTANGVYGDYTVERSAYYLPETGAAKQQLISDANDMVYTLAGNIELHYLITENATGNQLTYDYSIKVDNHLFDYFSNDAKVNCNVSKGTDTELIENGDSYMQFTATAANGSATAWSQYVYDYINNTPTKKLSIKLNNSSDTEEIGVNLLLMSNEKDLSGKFIYKTYSITLAAGETNTLTVDISAEIGNLANGGLTLGLDRTGKVNVLSFIMS